MPVFYHLRFCNVSVHNGSGFFFLAHNYLYKNHVVEKSYWMTKDKIFIGTLFMNPDFNY